MGDMGTPTRLLAGRYGALFSSVEQHWAHAMQVHTVAAALATANGQEVPKPPTALPDAAEEVVRHFRLHLLKEDLAYAKDEGTKEIEIVSTSLIREDGGDGQRVSSGQTLTIQLDLKAVHPVDDPVISFALHDQDNRFIYGTNTDWMGLHFHPFEGKKRLRFHLRNLPFVRGKFWVTLGVHSKDAAAVYHVQEQRYSFEVQHGEENTGEVFIPVDVEVEDL